MGLRTILYGYRKEHLSYYIVPEEAEIVRKIFTDYISGITLKSIADELTRNSVVYYQDKTSWTKNAVCRIIENARYAGDMEYPAIISKTDFETAVSMKNDKGGTREKDTAEIAWLKRKMQCAECGCRFSRRRHYSGQRENWACVNGCKTEIYIDDAVLYEKILNVLNSVTENPLLLKHDIADTESYEPTLEILRNEREIDRMIEQKNPRFLPIKKAIYDCTANRFECCRLDCSESVTTALIEYISQLPPLVRLDFELLKKLVNGITVYKDGSLSVQFLNHKTVNEKETINDADRDITESCY